MESLTPILILLGLFIGFLIFLLLGRKNLAEPRTAEYHPQKMIHHPRHPEPLPEDPAVSQKLLQILKENEISFEEFGGLVRAHGRVIYGIQLDWKQANTAWEKLTQVLPPHGFWPMFANQHFQIGSPQEEFTLRSPAPEDLIRLAEKYPHEKFFTEIEDMLTDRQQNIERGTYWGAAEVPDRDEPSRDVGISSSNLLAFIPTPHSWQAPAYLTMDYMLGIKDHIALRLLKYWEEKYGARVFFATQLAMEIRIEQRPETKEEALQLAFEQSYFCGDLYQMIYLNPEDLAADLMLKSYWEFWWD